MPTLKQNLPNSIAVIPNQLNVNLALGLAKARHRNGNRAKFTNITKLTNNTKKTCW